MSEDDAYKLAYERERVARQRAEELLDEKTRSLYDNVVELRNTVEELKQTQEKLIQSEKMASIGQLAAGVAHEINNPIGFSLSNLNVLSEYLEALQGLDNFVERESCDATFSFQERYRELRQAQDIDFVFEDAPQLLEDSIKGLKRVGAIVANLKRVSHAGELEKELCNLNDVVEESLKVVWSELKYNMKLKKELGELPQIACHTGEIHQVLMNLFINASHACEEGGVLQIKTRAQPPTTPTDIVIEISDNGKGMSEQVRKKIFDPFFTTKAVGSGTGLGLSVSAGIIEKHGGTIEVVSKENVGTKFTICLPLHD